MTLKRARELLESIRGKRVLLVGDLMMDEWVIASVKRISPEAPIPVVAMPLTQQARTHKPGGAGNVAAILLGLGARVRVLGVVGEDELGERLLADLGGRGADVSGVLRDSSRPTSHKMRILAGRQQLLRVDTESTEPLAEGLAVRVREELRAGLSEAEVVLAADYAKGVLSEVSLPGELIGEARARGVPLCADPKPENIDLFRGASLVSPNEAEALQAIGPANSQATNGGSSGAAGDDIGSLPDDLPLEVARAGRLLRERLEAEAVFVTMGDAGIAVFPREGATVLIPARRFTPPGEGGALGATVVGDSTGCGDAVSATAALTVAAGSSYQEAAELANAAGGVVSRYVGVYSPPPAEIAAAFNPGSARNRQR